jgi:hypothetical protein
VTLRNSLELACRDKNPDAFERWFRVSQSTLIFANNSIKTINKANFCTAKNACVPAPKLWFRA